MDKEVRKTIKKLLWLDSIFESSGSFWSILDEIEEELEEMLGGTRKDEISLEKFFKIDKDDQ